MNNKTFDLQILTALIEYANKLITTGHITVEENGQYTAYNLAKGKNDMGEPLHIEFEERNEPTTLQIGGFTCTVTPASIFKVICKFEKVCGVIGAKKARFVFGSGNDDTIIKGRAMYLNKKGEVKTQSKPLKQVGEQWATDKDGGLYYQVRLNGIWYCIIDHPISLDIVKRDFSLEFTRNRVNDIKANSPESRWLPIYEALLAEWDAIADTGTNDTATIEADEQVKKAEVEISGHEKTKRTLGTRFTFSMCGIQPGEKIVFTPEQMEVTVADDTHIEFCGELFTLSGFCKAFMPDGKRKPSNAYQGPKYFTYNGVTLVKLRTEKAICVEVETEAVETEGNTLVLPSKLAQERTNAHDWVTNHRRQNNGLERIFIRSTKVHLSEATMCRMESFIKRGYTVMQKVVHTMPLPPPKYIKQIQDELLSTNNKTVS